MTKLRTHLSTAIMLAGAGLVFWWIFANTKPCKPRKHSNTLQEWIDCRPL